MTEFQRRRKIPPPRNVDEIEVSNLAVFIAAVGILAERARASSRISELIGCAERSVETIRRRLFSDQLRPADDYDEPRSEISAFLVSCRRIFWSLAAFSGLSNLLMLTGSFFMLQVYDRVLPGRSIPTLVALLVLAIVLYLFQGGLDLVRSRISGRIGRYFDEKLGLRVFEALVRLPLKTRGDGDAPDDGRDRDRLLSFHFHLERPEVMPCQARATTPRTINAIPTTTIPRIGPPMRRSSSRLHPAPRGLRFQPVRADFDWKSIHPPIHILRQLVRVHGIAPHDVLSVRGRNLPRLLRQSWGPWMGCKSIHCRRPEFGSQCSVLQLVARVWQCPGIYKYRGKQRPGRPDQPGGGSRACISYVTGNWPCFFRIRHSTALLEGLEDLTFE